MANNNKHTGPNVPALRFPEFSGEWESKSLGEIGESLIGLTYSPSDVVKEGGTIVFRSSNIQNGVMDYGDLVRVSKKIKDAIVTREGDLLICARNGSTRLIGKNALLRKSDEGQTFGAFMMVFRSDDNRFVHQLLSTKAYSTQVSENLGARINQITTRNFAEYTFNMPPIPEEKEKLGVFLELINDRIETQSKIIEELNILRSALIEEVFQSPCDTIAIGSVAYQTLERNRKSIYTNVLSVSNRYGFINQSEQFEDRNVASDDVRNYKIVRNGDFAYNPARINVGSIAMLRRFDSGIVSPMYVCFRIDTSIVDPSYFELFLKSRSFKDEMEIRLEGSVRRCLSFDAMREIHIPCPDIKDQCTIAENIGKISSKLELEEGILAAYADQKAWLLNQMFI